MHAFFTDFLKITPTHRNPTRLILFSNAKEYAPYRLNDAAIAFYQPGPDRDYIVMSSFDADPYPVVVHEYAHLMIRYSGANYPIWLNEGIAEFYSTMTPAGGKMLALGRVPEDRLQYLASGVSLMDFTASLRRGPSITRVRDPRSTRVSSIRRAGRLRTCCSPTNAIGSSRASS